MSLGGYDPAKEARFQATMEVEIRYLKEQMALVWQHHSKRRTEIAQVEDRLTGQIEAIRKRINGAVLWFAGGAAIFIVGIVKAKIGL